MTDSPADSGAREGVNVSKRRRRRRRRKGAGGGGNGVNASPNASAAASGESQSESVNSGGANNAASHENAVRNEKSGQAKRRRHRGKPRRDQHSGEQNKPAANPSQPSGEVSKANGAANTGSHSRNNQRRRGRYGRHHDRRAPAYAALDLGTNNCRLLVAIPDGSSFRVIDAFSRIVRLGEGIAGSGRLSDGAMDRAVEALKVCNSKLVERGIKRRRLIATEACRVAENGAHFIDRVEKETGLQLEIVNRETEARLAVSGCASLVDRHSEGALLFDIGGGSSELVWLDLNDPRTKKHKISRRIRSWSSLPVGVVNISERHGGKEVTPEIFEAMISEVLGMLEEFPQAAELGEAVARGKMHFLGTSGTVTTLAGVHLGLKTYDRRRVDGIWMQSDDVSAMVQQLLNMSYEERVRNNCIGAERADLVLGGCAILEAIRRKWPCERLRVADRGLREGILYELMSEDGVLKSNNRRRGNQRGKSHPHKQNSQKQKARDV